MARILEQPGSLEMAVGKGLARRQSDPSYIPVLTDGTVEPEGPSFSEQYGAWMRQETSWGVGYGAYNEWGETMAGSYKADNWNPYAYYSQNKEQFGDLEFLVRSGSFEHAQNPEHFDFIANRLRQEMKDREIIAQEGLSVAAISALLSDPINYAPLAVLRKSSLAVRLAMGGLSLGGPEALREAGAHGTQYLRTTDESMWNVGVATALGGVLGGVFGKAAKIGHPGNRLTPGHPENPITAGDPAIGEIRLGQSVSEGEAAGSMRATGEDTEMLGGGGNAFTKWMSQYAGPTSRSLHWANAKAREVTQKLFDLGGSLTKGHERGIATVSVEDYKGDWMIRPQAEMDLAEANRFKLLEELGSSPGFLGREASKLGLSHGQKIDQGLFDRIVDRKLNSNFHQDTGRLDDVDRAWLAGELESRGYDAEKAMGAVDKYTDEVVNLMHKHNDETEKALIKHGLLDPEKALGKRYGSAQLYNIQFILDNPEQARAFFLDVFSKTPDEQWLADEFGMSLKEFNALDNGDFEVLKGRYSKYATEEEAAGRKAKDAATWVNETRTQVKEAWGIDDVAIATQKAEMAFKQAEAAYKNKVIEMESLMRAQGLVGDDLTKIDLKIAKEGARKGAIGVQTQRLKMSILKARREANTINNLEPFVAHKQSLGDMIDAQGAKLTELKTEPGGWSKMHREAVAKAEAELKATLTEAGHTQRWIDAHMAKIKKEVSDLSITDDMVDGMGRTLNKLEDQHRLYTERLAELEKAKAELKAERKLFNKVAQQSKQELKAATKDLGKAERALKKAQGRTPLLNRVDELISKLTDRQSLPKGILDLDVVSQSDRLRPRQIHYSDEMRRRGVEMGILDTNIYKNRMMAMDDLGGRLALQEAFGEVSLSKVLAEVEESYTQEILRLKALRSSADEAGKKKLDKQILELQSERKTVRDDIAQGRDRILGTGRVPEHPDHVLTWGIGAARKQVYIAYGAGFLMSSLTDLAVLTLHAGFKGELFGAFKQFRKILKNARKDPKLMQDLRVLVKSAEYHSANSRMSRMFQLDEDLYRTGGVGTRGTKKYATTHAIDRVQDVTGAAVTRYGGMEWWNRTLKGVAGVSMVNDLRKMITGFSGLPQAQKTKLASLGVNEETASRIAKYMQKYGEDVDDIFDPRAQLWATEGAEGADAARSFRIAVRKMMDRAVMTPGAGDTPLIMSNTYGRLLLQLQTFGFTVVNRFLRPGAQRLTHYKDTEAMMSFAMVMGLGALIVAIKDVIAGRDTTDRTVSEFLYETFDRSGAIAYMSPYASGAFKLFAGPVNEALGVNLLPGQTTKYAQNQGWENFLGPAASVGRNVWQMGSGVAQGDWEKAGKKALLLSPFNQWIRLGTGIAEAYK